MPSGGEQVGEDHALRSISELPPGAADQALTDRLLTVIADGLRPRR
jgi:hypothetical protein